MSAYWKSTRPVIILSILVISFSGHAFASGCHGGGDSGQIPPGTSHSGMSMMPMAPRQIQNVDVDGMGVSLDVMDMAMHVHMQQMKQHALPGGYDRTRSHAIMIMIKGLKSNETISGVEVTVTVVSPSGEKKTGRAVWSGDHYGESFTPREKGTYRIKVKAADRDGKEREAEFKYENA